VSCVDPALSNCFLWLLVIYIYPLYLRRGQPMHFHLISNMPTYFHCIYSPQVVASRNCMAASEGPMVGCCMKSFTRSLYNRVICAINGSLLPSTLWIQSAFTRISYIGIKPKLSDSSHQSCHLGTTVESCFVPPSLPYALVPDGAKWSSAPFAPLVAIVIITIKEIVYSRGCGLGVCGGA